MSKILVPGAAPNYKHIFESLDILNRLNKNHYVSIGKPGSQFDMAVANLKKQDRGFVLSFEDQRAYNVDLGNVNDVKILTSEYLLRADKIFINHISDSTISGKLSSFYTDGFDRKAKNFFRLRITFNSWGSTLLILHLIVYESDVTGSQVEILSGVIQALTS